MVWRSLLLAPLCEGALILLAALAAFWTRQPLLFASLGPTAFELIEAPKRRSARAWNVIAGHAIGVSAAFLALWLTHAWSAPAVGGGPPAWSRVWAAALAAALTVFGTLLARAQQPAAISTCLLVSLGTMQRGRDVLFILGSVVLMVVAARPLRRLRVAEGAEGPGDGGVNE